MKKQILLIFFIALNIIISSSDPVRSQEIPTIDQQLLQAVKQGKTEAVRAILEKGADVETRDKAGSTLLMIATTKGYREIVRILIEKNVSVNATTRNSFTALYGAAMTGNIEIVELLLENGADVNVGRPAIISAAQRNRIDIMRLLLNHGTVVKDTDILLSVMNPSAAEFLIKNGADVNAQDRHGNTVLIRKFRYSDRAPHEIIKVLIENNADLSIKNNEGKTALMIAAERGDNEIARFLIDSGADINELSEEVSDNILNTKEVPEIFLGWWINSGYLENIQNKITPFNYKANSPDFYFLNFIKEQKVMIATLNEGWYQNLRVVNDNEIKILDWYSTVPAYKASTINRENAFELIMTNKDSNNTRYSRYPEKYINRRPPTALLNDLFFCGKYFSEDHPGIEIEFRIDGTLNGLAEYSNYSVGSGFGPPSIDWVNLWGEGQRKRDTYHWKVEGDHLYIYKIKKNDTAPYSEAGELYLKLRKISR